MKVLMEKRGKLSSTQLSVIFSQHMSVFMGQYFELPFLVNACGRKCKITSDQRNNMCLQWVMQQISKFYRKKIKIIKVTKKRNVS